MVSSKRPRSTWSAKEIADVVELTWRQFHAKYPSRSHDNYRSRRRILRDEGFVFPDGRTEPHRYEKPTMEIKLGDQAEPISIDRLWQLYDIQRELHHARAAKQVQAEITVKIETDRPVGVCFLSDFHLGNVGTDHRALLQDVSLITSCELMTAFVGGDGIDNMIMGKLASVQRDSGSSSPDLQYLALSDILNRLLPNLIAIGTGNHDNWTKRLAGIDGLSVAIADKPIVNTGERSLINLYVGKQLYKIFRKHRPIYSSIYNLGHSVQQLWRLGEVDFDLGVVEHQHCTHTSWFNGHGKPRLAVRTGSYKTHDSFASEFTALNGGGIGTPVVVFNPHEREMTPFMSISSAIEYLEIL